MIENTESEYQKYGDEIEKLKHSTIDTLRKILDHVDMEHIVEVGDLFVKLTCDTKSIATLQAIEMVNKEYGLDIGVELFE